MSKNRTKQRSWTDYDGDKPIKFWEKDGFYNGQPLPVPLAPDKDSEEPEMTFTPRRKKRSSALQSAMDELGLV